MRSKPPRKRPTPPSLAVYLAELEERYFEHSDGSALLDAIHLCLSTDTPAPDWVKTRLLAAWQFKWKSGQARTLGEAFSIERPANWSQARSRKDGLMLMVFLMVEQRRRQRPRPALGWELWDSVAEELNDLVESASDEKLNGLKFNGADVRDAYHFKKRSIIE